MLSPMPYLSFGMRRHVVALITVALVVPGMPLASIPLAAQWIKYPTAGVPRKADGTVNMAAPAPRLADGKPDFSGVWTTGDPNIRRAGAGLSTPKEGAAPRDEGYEKEGKG